MSDPGHSEALLDHLRNPRNPGSLPRHDPYVRTGEAGSPDGTRLVRLQFRVDASGRIGDACFKAFGCSATIACASWVVERVEGELAAATFDLGPDALCDALELSGERRDAANLALGALQAALVGL